MYCTMIIKLFCEVPLVDYTTDSKNAGARRDFLINFALKTSGRRQAAGLTNNGEPP